jgi:hypothetical protein
MTHRGLRSALTNPTVAGLRRDGNGGYVQGNWAPIINRADWDALNATFGNPERRTASTNRIVHLLSGIMECGRCGETVGIRKWKANPTKRQPYVQESHRLTCVCGNSIDEANANDVVMSRMWEVITPSQWATWKIAGSGWDEAVINEIQRMREKIITLEVQGKISAEYADTQLRELDNRESVATGETPLDLPDTDDPRKDWESLDIIDQRKIVSHAFESITLQPANGTRDPRKRVAMV